jgi:hypothetical protein
MSPWFGRCRRCCSLCGVVGLVGLARCWVLRGHLLWVLLGAAPGLAGLTRGLIPGCVGVCLCGGGCGVRGVVVC